MKLECYYYHPQPETQMPIVCNARRGKKKTNKATEVNIYVNERADTGCMWMLHLLFIQGSLAQYSIEFECQWMLPVWFLLYLWYSYCLMVWETWFGIKFQQTWMNLSYLKSTLSLEGSALSYSGGNQID